MSASVEMLRIRCTSKVKQEFKVHAAPFKNYNKALESLLEDSKRLDVVRTNKIKS